MRSTLRRRRAAQAPSGRRALGDMRRRSRYSLTIPHTARHIRSRRRGHIPAQRADDHTHLGARTRPARRARRGPTWRVTRAHPLGRPGHYHSAAAPHTPQSSRRLRHHRRAPPTSHQYIQVVHSLPSHGADSHHNPNSPTASGYARPPAALAGARSRPGQGRAAPAAHVDHRADRRDPPMVGSPGLTRRGGAKALSAAPHGGRSSPRSRHLAPRPAPCASAPASHAHLPSQAPRLAGHRRHMRRDHRSDCSLRRSFDRARGHL